MSDLLSRNDVIVDNKLYYWQIKSNADSNSLAVHQRNQGQLLICDFCHTMPVEMTNELLASIIVDAKLNGWRPEKKGFNVQQYTLPATLIS